MGGVTDGSLVIGPGIYPERLSGVFDLWGVLPWPEASSMCTVFSPSMLARWALAEHLGLCQVPRPTLWSVVHACCMLGFLCTSPNVDQISCSPGNASHESTALRQLFACVGYFPPGGYSQARAFQDCWNAASYG